MPGYGPLPTIPNVIKVVIENEGNDGRLAANVCHFVYGGVAPSSSSCISIATAFWNAWVSDLTPRQPAQTSLSKVTVTDLSSDTGGEGSYDHGGAPVPGTSVHGMLPYHTCALVSKVVERRYRGGHARMYLPVGTTDDLNDDGDWKDTFVTDIRASWEDIISTVIASNPYGGTNVGEECMVSYVSKFANPVYPYRRAVPLVNDIPIDGYSVSQKLATQRRRVRKTARRR